MTHEFNLDDMTSFMSDVVKECPHCKFHVVDLENFDEQNKTEQIHAFIVIPQWSDRNLSSRLKR
jgi:hypothetical protein